VPENIEEYKLVPSIPGKNSTNINLGQMTFYEELLRKKMAERALQN